MNVILYSTGCPKCNVLKKKLDKANVDYSIISDKEVILKTGFTVVPVLQVDDKFLEFKEANEYLNTLMEG